MAADRGESDGKSAGGGMIGLASADPGGAPDGPEIPSALLARIRAARALPTIPGVAMKVVELCDDDSSSLADIARVLERDPALAAKLLRFANSAYVAPRTPITTVSRAVTTLGLVAVQTLAVSFTLVGELQRSPRPGMNHRRYWMRSLLSAVAGRTVAGALGARAVDESFLAALLQDIGILVLERSLGDSYAELHTHAGADHERLIELERLDLGIDHSAISAWLVHEWHLPRVFAAAALASHSYAPGEAVRNDPAAWKLAQSVALSGRIADLWMLDDAALAGARAEYDAAEFVGLTRERLERIVLQTGEQFEDAARLVQLPDLPSQVAAGVLEKAKDLLVGLALRTAEERGQLEENARRDALTGLYNRRHLDRTLQRLVDDTMVHGTALTVALIDVDHFKRVNDEHGHAAGDQVLQTVARCIVHDAREDDIAGRFGGEEFVLLLPATDLEGGRVACERLRERIEAEHIVLSTGPSVSVTVSIGYASADPAGTTAESILQTADQALYRAKRAGRNRVEGG